LFRGFPACDHIAIGSAVEGSLTLPFTWEISGGVSAKGSTDSFAKRHRYVFARWALGSRGIVMNFNLIAQRYGLINDYCCVPSESHSNNPFISTIFADHHHYHLRVDRTVDEIITMSLKRWISIMWRGMRIVWPRIFILVKLCCHDKTCFPETQKIAK
jgi:hypothetical protein